MKVTSEQVVTTFINRIKEVNPILNCVVDVRVGDAIEEAKQVDELLRSSTEREKEDIARNRPFLGVPFTTKDCFAVTGQSWTAGLLARYIK